MLGGASGCPDWENTRTWRFPLSSPEHLQKLRSSPPALPRSDASRKLSSSPSPEFSGSSACSGSGQGQLKVGSPRARRPDPDPAEHPADVVADGDLAISDRAIPVGPQQVQGQGAQQCQHLNTVAFGVVVGVLTEAYVPHPVPFVLDRPALPHQAQQGLGTGPQGRQKMVDMPEGLAVPNAGGHQLDDPAGPAPALRDGLTGIAGPQMPPHLAAVACLESALLDWEVALIPELIADLTEQLALVAFDAQEQVGPLLGGELKNEGEVCSASA